MCLVREGDVVEAGQPLFELYADDDEHLTRGRETIAAAVILATNRSLSNRSCLKRSPSS